MGRITKAEKQYIIWWETRGNLIAKFLGSGYRLRAFDPDFSVLTPTGKILNLEKIVGERIYEFLIAFDKIYSNVESRLACPFCYQSTEDNGCLDNCPWKLLKLSYGEK